jgi:hypothetical protein
MGKDLKGITDLLDKWMRHGCPFLCFRQNIINVKNQDVTPKGLREALRHVGVLQKGLEFSMVSPELTRRKLLIRG